MREWTRRNRWGLLALPLLAALVFAGNGIRLDDYWWNLEPRNATTADKGEWVTFRQDFHDAAGDATRTVKVRLDGIREVTSIPQSFDKTEPVPGGVRALEVDLSFAAKPDQYLRVCQLALRGKDGERYQFASSVGLVTQMNVNPCVPDDQPGPASAIFKGDNRQVPEGEERPETWELHPIVFVPKDADITQVLLWWELPDYLQLSTK